MIGLILASLILLSCAFVCKPLCAFSEYPNVIGFPVGSIITVHLHYAQQWSLVSDDGLYV